MYLVLDRVCLKFLSFLYLFFIFYFFPFLSLLCTHVVRLFLSDVLLVFGLLVLFVYLFLFLVFIFCFMFPFIPNEDIVRFRHGVKETLF